MARDVAALVEALTLDEKAAVLAGADLWSTVAVDRVGIPSVQLTDGPNGARGPMLPGATGSSAPALTSLCVPAGTALGATWDVELVERVGRAIGAEARTKACRVLLAPTVNLHRSPLGGRNFESYSEDPLLSGRIAAGFVRGAQDQGVVCTVKHLAGNESEAGRMLVDTIVDERTLRELYLVPFEVAVREGGALGVMTAYNRLNGEHCANSRWLLADVLRGDWGFQGFVVSDWFAFADTAPAIGAGLDLEMPGPGRAYGAALADAVRSGDVDEELVDAAARRLLGVLERIGAFGDTDLTPRAEDVPEHRLVAREAAIAGMVLLRNHGVLPLDRDRLRRVAVVGPNAGRAVIMGGGSSSLVVPESRSPLEALRDRLGPAVEVVHEPGVDIALTTPEIPGAWLTSDGDPGVLVECGALDALGGGPALHTQRFPTGSLVWWGAPAGVGGSDFSWRARAELTVPNAGRWRLSLVRTDPVELLVDGEVALDATTPDPRPGHDFFGLGSREATCVLDLGPDRPVHLELRGRVEAPGFVIGTKVGLRPALAEDAVERAVAAAAGADATIVVVGTDGDWESEGHDRDSLALPGAQDELVARVLDVANDAVVVVNAGSVVAAPWADRAGAVLQSWFGGIEMAEALTDVLLGRADPGGRLPTTVPHRLTDTPSWGAFPGEGGRIRYGEGILVGYRWYESRGIDVAYPFGHGESYTQFEIGAPEVSASTFSPGDRLVVAVPVTNVGDRAGTEVVQLYVAPPPTGTFRPDKELRAFGKVALAPGERTVVELVLGDRAFARWADPDPALASLVERQRTAAPWVPPAGPVEEPGWVLDPGDHELLVGRSSADIAHVVTVAVTGGRARA